MLFRSGWGTVYHAAAAFGALAPFAIGQLEDLGWSLSVAMATGIGLASAVALALTAVSHTSHSMLTER